MSVYCTPVVLCVAINCLLNASFTKHECAVAGTDMSHVKQSNNIVWSQLRRQHWKATSHVQNVFIVLLETDK